MKMVQPKLCGSARENPAMLKHPQSDSDPANIASNQQACPKNLKRGHIEVVNMADMVDVIDSNHKK